MTSRPADLVLASSSEARRRILSAAGVNFIVRPAVVDEPAIRDRLLSYGAGPKRIAIELAEAKALAASGLDAGGWVLAADQTMDLNGAVFSKPESLDDALSQLQRLSGRWHRLHSAFCFAQGGRVQKSGVLSAALKMRKMEVEELQHYLALAGASVLTSVGAYQIEGAGISLFDAVAGDQSTIMGLPAVPVLRFWNDVISGRMGRE